METSDKSSWPFQPGDRVIYKNYPTYRSGPSFVDMRGTVEKCHYHKALGWVVFARDWDVGAPRGDILVKYLRLDQQQYVPSQEGDRDEDI